MSGHFGGEYANYGDVALFAGAPPMARGERDEAAEPSRLAGAGAVQLPLADGAKDSTSSSPPTDRELWQRAVAGETDCFGTIFKRHVQAVHSYCARRLGSDDVADDVVSTVFLESWRRRAEVEMFHESALPWLYGVAANTMRTLARSTARHRTALTRLSSQTSEHDHAELVAMAIDSRERVAGLRAAFARLSDNDQDVLLLCVWQGLDYRAAALALGVPVGTVRSRLSRARERLAGHLDAVVAERRSAVLTSVKRLPS